MSSEQPPRKPAPQVSSKDEFRAATTKARAADSLRYERVQPEGDRRLPSESRKAHRPAGGPHADPIDDDRRKVWEGTDGRTRLREGRRSLRGDRFRERRPVASGLVSESAGPPDRDRRG